MFELTDGSNLSSIRIRARARRSVSHCSARLLDENWHLLPLGGDVKYRPVHMCVIALVRVPMNSFGVQDSRIACGRLSQFAYRGRHQPAAVGSIGPVRAACRGSGSTTECVCVYVKLAHARTNKWHDDNTHTHT